MLVAKKRGRRSIDVLLASENRCRRMGGRRQEECRRLFESPRKKQNNPSASSAGHRFLDGEVTGWEEWPWLDEGLQRWLEMALEVSYLGRGRAGKNKRSLRNV